MIRAYRIALYQAPPALRGVRLVRFGQRMKPRSWPCDFWFASGLFERGDVNRKVRFRTLMRRDVQA